jgi:hypothetical protein
MKNTLSSLVSTPILIYISLLTLLILPISSTTLNSLSNTYTTIFQERASTFLRGDQVRELSQKDLMSDSQDCKVNCIDADKTFCPTAGHKSGYCCPADYDNCPRTDWCSNDTGNHNLQYFACPFSTSMCGKFAIAPDNDESVTEVTLGKASTDFVIDNVCMYNISFPDEADYGDQIYF